MSSGASSRLLGELGRVSTGTNGVVTATIDRPPVNAVRFADLAALNGLVKELETADEVRCVVLGAAGERVRLPGTDVDELQGLTAETARRNTDLVQELLDRMYELPAPIVAAINGAALGLGMAIASVCDMRIVSENATFGLPELDLAVMGGSKYTARLLPQGKTRLMMYTGWRIDAEEALRLGLVEAVVPPADLAAEAARVADTIAEKYPLAVRFAKLSLNRTEFMALHEGYAYECTLTTKLRDDPQAQEVARAFLESYRKRKKG